MDRHFTAEEWTRLTDAERITRCQSWADEALRLSRMATVPIIAERYLKLAEDWLRLAKELATVATAPNSLRRGQ